MRLDPGISISDFDINIPVASAQCEYALLFCGTLNNENGLQFLLEAFNKLKNLEIELWISGRGPLQAQVELVAAQNPRLRFIGFIERQELLKTMRRCLILVNPRQPSLAEHRYNFPSKILEYMASGRPVISLASSDIGQEYGNYLILLKEETPEAFAELIDDTLKRPPEELDELGRKGREYVMSQKNWRVLSRNVYSLLLEAKRESDT